MNLKGKNLIILILVVVCLVLGGALVYSGSGKKLEKNVISPQEAVNLALAYINESILKGQAEASLAGEIAEEGGVYKFQLKVGEQKFFSYVTKDGKVFFPEGIDLEQEKAEEEQKVKEKGLTLGNFLATTEEVCQEGGKPIVYFFGSQGCPHCVWEEPVIEEVAKSFGDFISFHNNMDSEVELDIFGKYSQGGIPTIVLGCKYFRVGSGENLGQEEEKKVLTALICNLTGKEPVDVCEKVEDLIREIKR
ncbi:MAG: thioredoxin family protein [Patescibacteria group bacterium]|nr:thioredoxin family protein [Patescibacteria group bacterium]